MKTNFKTFRQATCCSFAGVISTGAFLLISANAPAQNLFEAELSGGTVNVYEYTPGGTRSTFASWSPDTLTPEGLAFNSAGDLFVSDTGSGNIYEFTPGGAQSIFVTGLNNPFALAFQPVPEPSGLGLLAAGAAALLVRCRRNSTPACP